MIEQFPVASQPITACPRPWRIGPPLVVALLAVLYCAGASLLGWQSPCGNDFGGIFEPSARYALAGHALDMYSVRVGLYPNANGPLGELAMAAVMAVGRVFGLQLHAPLCPQSDVYPVPGDSSAMRALLGGVFALIALGIGAELLWLADRYRRHPFTGWRRLLIWCLILVAPPLWDGLVYYGHYEQVLALGLALLAVRYFTAQRVALAGILLGLALLCRTTSMFVVIPLGLVLLFERQWWQIGRFGSALGGTVALGLLPFYLHDRNDLVYSLSSFRAQEPILDGSFWTFLRGTHWESLAQPWDSTVAIALAIVLCATMIWLGKVHQQSDPALYATICVAMVCFAAGLKATWGYYFTEPLVWGLAWALARRKLRQPWWEFLLIPGFFSLMMILTELRISYTTSQDLTAEPGIMRIWVLVMSATCAASLLAFNGVMLAKITRRAGPLVPRLARVLAGLGALGHKWYNNIRPQNNVVSH